MAFSNPPEALLDQQVIALIAAHFRLEAQEVTASSSMVYDLGADSSDLLEVSIQLSEVFDCDLDTQRLGRVVTVADFCALVQHARVNNPIV